MMLKINGITPIVNDIVANVFEYPKNKDPHPRAANIIPTPKRYCPICIFHFGAIVTLIISDVFQQD